MDLISWCWLWDDGHSSRQKSPHTSTRARSIRLSFSLRPLIMTSRASRAFLCAMVYSSHSQMINLHITSVCARPVARLTLRVEFSCVAMSIGNLSVKWAVLYSFISDAEIPEEALTRATFSWPLILTRIKLIKNVFPVLPAEASRNKIPPYIFAIWSMIV